MPCPSLNPSPTVCAELLHRTLLQLDTIGISRNTWFCEEFLWDRDISFVSGHAFTHTNKNLVETFVSVETRSFVRAHAFTPIGQGSFETFPWQLVSYGTSHRTTCIEIHTSTNVCVCVRVCVCVWNHGLRPIWHICDAIRPCSNSKAPCALPHTRRVVRCVSHWTRQALRPDMCLIPLQKRTQCEPGVVRCVASLSKSAFGFTEPRW